MKNTGEELALRSGVCNFHASAHWKGVQKRATRTTEALERVSHLERCSKPKPFPIVRSLRRDLALVFKACCLKLRIFIVKEILTVIFFSLLKWPILAMENKGQMVPTQAVIHADEIQGAERILGASVSNLCLWMPSMNSTYC